MKKKSGLIIGGVLIALFLGCLILLEPANEPPSASTQDQQPLAELPWHIETLPSGASRVFGLTLSTQPLMGSTLGDAQRRWTSDFQLAVVAEPGQKKESLEGFVETATMGFITGRLVVTASVSPETMKNFKEHAANAEVMVNSARRYSLNAVDTATALRSPIVALTFIPQVNLDDDIVKARFGEPTERVRSNEHAEQWLYPEKGLGITVDSEGREVLQYVAPAQFEQRIRQPRNEASEANQ